MIDAEVQGSKVFFGARRPAELSYVVGGSRPASVQVELVRAADGAVVQQWAPRRGRSPASRRRVRWDGTVDGEVERDGALPVPRHGDRRVGRTRDVERGERRRAGPARPARRGAGAGQAGPSHPARRARSSSCATASR